MTYQEAYQTALSLAQPAASEDCVFDVSQLFAHIFGFERYRLPLCGGEAADEGQALALFALCRRYAAGEPLQYLLGRWEFYGLPFQVGEGVLIPRPDTELLVDTALELLRDKTAPTVADLCAGSGCISVSVAHLRPDAAVFALELSEQAFPYLTANIAANGAAVKALRCDVLVPPALPALDLALSNPPYIRRGDLAGLQLQVRCEPQMALDGGGDGLDFYRALPALYFPLLKPGGELAFEVGYDQAEQVAEILWASGYRGVEKRKDFAGIWRVVFGRRPF